MGQPKKPQFEIRIRSLSSSIPWDVRLRGLLKTMLRGYRFRVVSYRELDGGEDDKGVSDNDNEIE